MKSTPILVCSDAGAAGRVLLARLELDLRWALSAHEAIAALGAGAPQVVITRELLAAEVLAAAARASSAPPCIVLLESAAGESAAARWLARGARSVVSQANGHGILGAISELTNVAFATHPRVPLATLLEVETGGDRYFLESVDLSASGVTIHSLPDAAVGQRVEVCFAAFDPPIIARGVVVRTFVKQGDTIAGVRLDEVGDRDRARLVEIVREKLTAQPRLPEPVGLTSDLAGTNTLDLKRHAEPEGDAIEAYRGMLRAAIEEPKSAAEHPGWLRRIALRLTPLERASLVGMPAPCWVLAAIDLRIGIARARTRDAGGGGGGSGGDRSEGVARVFELSRTIAKETEREPPDVAAAATLLRAELLREVYGTPSAYRIGTVTEARAPAERMARRTAHL